MATEAIQPNAQTGVRRLPHSNRAVNRTAERIFFGSMAVLLCAIVVYGFSRSYFFAGMVLAPLPNLLVHIHGAAFSLWMVLFLVQTALVSARRVAWHRALGTIAFCLPPIMVILGTITALDGLRRGSTIGPFDPAASLALPLLGIWLFAAVIYAAWQARRRPDAHKRLVLLATIGLCEAALGRFPWDRFGVPPPAGNAGSLAVLLLLVAGYDLLTLRRVHRSTLWAAPLLFIFGAFSLPFGTTPLWQSVAHWLAVHVAPLV